MKVALFLTFIQKMQDVFGRSGENDEKGFTNEINLYMMVASLIQFILERA